MGVLSRKHFILVAGLIAWALLYAYYVLTHDHPINAAGFYLQAADDLIRSGYRLPEVVTDFGPEGVPFAYPPLGIAIYALGAEIFGAAHLSALYLPGLFLPLQALAGYLVFRRLLADEQAAQWAAVILMLWPHLYIRTMFGDGITTGAAGTLLLLSWLCALNTERAGYLLHAALGGLCVGLSVLAHPGVGLFCIASFATLVIWRRGITLQMAAVGLISGGVTLALLMLLWLLPVYGMHGMAPFEAALLDSKSGGTVSDLKGTIFYAYDKHMGNPRDAVALALIGFPLSLLYLAIRGPRVFFVLLILGVFTFKGHPLVSFFALSAASGLFLARGLVPVFQEAWSGARAEAAPGAGSAMGGVAAAALIVLMSGFAFISSHGDKATGERPGFAWMQANTAPDATFVMDGLAENLVYYAQRRILLPVLGAEWLPSDYGSNALVANEPYKEALFACEDFACIDALLAERGLRPDHLVWRVKDHPPEVLETILQAEAATLVYGDDTLAVMRLAWPAE